MNIQDNINQLVQFRSKIYQSVQQRRDSVMDLLDALCANDGAKSVVELSLNGLFRREYSALYKAIEGLGGGVEVSPDPSPQAPSSSFPSAWIEAIADVVPAPKQRNYWLFGVDVTPVPRGHAVTLKDRECVYQPSVIAGNKPIALGHNYSLISALPEAEAAGGRSWLVPLSIERVSSFESKVGVGQAQAQRLFEEESLPWHQELCVLVADSDYSQRGFVYPSCTAPNRILVTRCRSNRVFYGLPDEKAQPRRGHPRWYGQRFDLKDETTWHPPDQQESFTTTTVKGKLRTVTLRMWHNLLMKGSKPQPMHRHPFDLLQVQLCDPTGKRVFAPQWLIVVGQQRRQLAGHQVYESYLERFHLEHGIRFSKQHLLMTQLQTPQVTTEERWVQLVILAYAQLWAARHLAQFLPRPWQRYLPTFFHAHHSPSDVQRDFSRIIRSIGTPAQSVQPRGKSPGRPKGFTLEPRPKRPLVKRGLARRKQRQKAA
jgi:DDE superfamily endonuclease